MDFSKYYNKISNSGGDEYGGIKGGKAGDQTGGEWNIRSWYNRPWSCVLRYPDAKVRELIAELAIEAAENNKIGYDQGQRQTYWNELKKVGYHPKNITTACEADCSAGVIANTKAAGALLGIPKLVNIPATYTGNMRSAFQAAGFQVLTDKKYLTSPDYLLPGDILLNDNHHTATNLGVGKYVVVKDEPHLNGIDISSHNAGINTEAVPADFIIVKATQGTGYLNPYFESQIDGVIKSGRIPGIYHYANGSGVNGEVNWFLQSIKKYIGKAFLCLDWETSDNDSGRNTQYRNVSYAKQFLDEVRKRTGLTMFIYGSKSCFREMDWSSVQKSGYPLWGAQYKNYDRIDGYQSNPWQSDKDWGAWGWDVKIHQYTSQLYLTGYNKHLDGDIGYLTAIALKGYTIAGTTSNPVVPPSDSENLDRASLLELVAQTLEDKFGRGEKRKKALGDRYEEVQSMINYIYSADVNTLADQVLLGKFGNDELRKRVLGPRYKEVQKKVNAKLKKQKSINTIAKEVIKGKWGNDPERTRKLRAAGYDSVAVQKEVNRLLAS